MVADVAGSSLVLADVLTGSCAKYVGQAYEWWTKGDDASLSDLSAGPDALPVACSRSG